MQTDLCEDIQEATVIACFGDFRELRVGEDGTRTPLGYSITVKESGGRTLAITLYQGVTEVWRTPLTTRVILVLVTVSLCTRGSQTFRVGGGGTEDEGVVRGRRTSVVYVKTTRSVERDAEIFANYGNEFLFAGGCVCHLCRLDGK